MALDPILWALKDSPVADAGERLILTVLAEAADEDGCNAYPSQATIARRALCTDRSVRNKLASMESRGLIVRGDQSLVQRFPADRRPIVWDLAIPYSWWGVRWERMNEGRTTRGQKPLNPVDRPDIAQPAEKAKPPRKSKNGRNDVPAVDPHTLNDRKDVPAGTSFRPEADSVAAGTEFRSDRNDVPTTHPYNPPQEPTPVSFGDAQPTLDLAAQPTAAPVGAAETNQKSEPKKSTKKGTRLPEPFTPTEDMIAWAREHTPNVGAAEHEKFCDYWRSVPGQRGVKLDWLATWRNWMRKAEEDAAHRKVMQERRAQGLRRGYDDVATWGKPEDEDPESETLTDDEVNIVFTVPAYVNSRGIPVNITNGDIVAAREYDAEGNVIPLTAEKYHQIAARKAGEATGTRG